MALTANCRKHGRQLAVGNWDECEKCLIEYKVEQMEQLEEIREQEIPDFMYIGD